MVAAPPKLKLGAGTVAAGAAAAGVPKVRLPLAAGVEVPNVVPPKLKDVAGLEKNNNINMKLTFPEINRN